MEPPWPHTSIHGFKSNETRFTKNCFRRSQLAADPGFNRGTRMTVKRAKLGQAYGRIDAETMVTIERCLAVFLGIVR